ncbi:hypothetical protein METHB2_80062 [Candidatus Methylobacter favarea]|uniref:Uncharacterized protein n=1 Tax=Candidatus Methylobacter favarea TaxID=2707345 RepID=A0A8S0WCT4_9GAMM|nr:hypothetical protein [Candidatus Methylobacter favarea]CAA9892745.1 hypothetical protein METHB2_80062 [Candidatus Methylobacter favarea]
MADLITPATGDYGLRTHVADQATISGLIVAIINNIDSNAIGDVLLEVIIQFSLTLKIFGLSAVSFDSVFTKLTRETL